jgi:hypothetical protein
MPELSEAVDACFSKVNVYYEGITPNGRGDGKCVAIGKWEECQSRIAYPVALK